MVVSLVNGAVWNPSPSAAGTGVQSQSGSAAQAFPLAGRLVAGRTPGSSRSEALPEVVGADDAALSDPRCRTTSSPPVRRAATG